MKKKPSTSEPLAWLKLLLVGDIGPETLRERDPKTLIPPLHSARTRRELERHGRGITVSPQAALQIVKIIHTIVWAIFVAAIVAIPLLAWAGLFRTVVVLAVLVGVEGIVLAVNSGRCPLTDLAARYTDNRDDNFDIYLPPWLARHGKVVFGGLFAVVLLFAAALWALERH